MLSVHTSCCDFERDITRDDEDINNTFEERRVIIRQIITVKIQARHA
jgi:hypothetical protein